MNEIINNELAKNKFYEKLAANEKIGSNGVPITRQEYEAKISHLIELQNDNNNIKKERKDYRMLERFAILEVDIEGQKVRKLVKKGTEKSFVCYEDLFDVIHKMHIQFHEGRTKMANKLNEMFANVTQEQITIYLQFCDKCQLIKPQVRKSHAIEVEPTDSGKMMDEKCQVIFGFINRRN